MIITVKVSHFSDLTLLILLFIAACDPACNDGLMRCTGSGSGDCCVAFEDGTCLATLECTENNFVANEQNNYNCGECNLSSTNCYTGSFPISLACGLVCDDGYTLDATLCNCLLTDICLADNPCDNGECMLGSFPNQYTCNCTGTNYTGINCSGKCVESTCTVMLLQKSEHITVFACTLRS